MDDKRLTADEVRTWLAAVEVDLRRVAERLTPLLDEQRQLEERQALLQGLLRSFEQSAPNGTGAPARGRATGSVARYVVERAMEILRDEGRPLHINDLHAKFLERGFAVPGAGKPVNLIVHLRGDQEIVSPMRGIYALAEQAEDVVQRPRQVKRRKRARTRRAPGRKS